MIKKTNKLPKRSTFFTNYQNHGNLIKFLLPIEKQEFDSAGMAKKKYKFAEHDKFRSAPSIIVRIK